MSVVEGRPVGLMHLELGKPMEQHRAPWDVSL